MRSVYGTVVVCTLFASTLAFADDFSVAFDWGDIPLCTSGSPNTVKNPRFVLKNVPADTKVVEFSLTDLDVPSYDHGGGTVEYNGQEVIEPGAFTYQSPCPPSGSHTYQWTASAKKSTGLFSGPIARATAARSYP